MMDSGGDSGRLRDEFGVLPPGDIRRCLVALSEETALMRELFSYRFVEDPLQGRSFGNLFFLALTKSLGSQKKSLHALSKILKIRGEVIAVTWDDVHVFARLQDGVIIKGEANIDVPKHDPRVPISDVYLEPPATANSRAIKAIGEADFILLAPGDLFTSTIPNLLVDGIPAAIQESRAPLVYITNLMTKRGETHGFTASHHIEEIVKYCGRVPDIVVAHQGDIPDQLARKYEQEQAHKVDIDQERIFELGVGEIVYEDIMCSKSLVRHDPDKIGDALLRLFNRFALAPAPSESEGNVSQLRKQLVSS